MDNETLLSITSRFFKIRGYSIEYDLKYEGLSGVLYNFDILIKKGSEERTVIVIDWKRTVGVNMIIKANKAVEDINLPNPIIVARRFSDHAKAFSNKKRITLMTEAEILS